MSKVDIWFGTESGNAEMVADEVSEALSAGGLETRITEMSDLDVTEIAELHTVVVITSTYGEGGLPATTEPFYDALLAQKPDLTELRFAAFGLGDSSYEHYSNGIDTLRAALADLGAHQVGDTGRHDALSGLDPAQVAGDWIAEVAPTLTPITVS